MQGFVHIRFVGHKFIPFGIWKTISHVINTTLMGKSARTEIDLNSGKQKPSQPVGFAESLLFPEYESTEIKCHFFLVWTSVT
jgi:hypothetical protein